MSYPYLARTTLKFKSPHAGDLSFAKDEVIRVTGPNPDDEEDWLIGETLDGSRAGGFPKDFIIMEEGDATVQHGDGVPAVVAAAAAPPAPVPSAAAVPEEAAPAAPPAAVASERAVDEESAPPVQAEPVAEPAAEPVAPVAEPPAPQAEPKVASPVAEHPSVVPPVAAAAATATAAAATAAATSPTSVKPTPAAPPPVIAAESGEAPRQSMKDRLAFFNQAQKKAAPPPPLKPKPAAGGLTWSQRQKLRQEQEAKEAAERAARGEDEPAPAAPVTEAAAPAPVAAPAADESAAEKEAGMSAADAQATVALSLKERMAALKAGGAFGQAAPEPPAPKPSGKVWTRPAAPPAPEPEEEGEAAEGVAAATAEEGETAGVPVEGEEAEEGEEPRELSEEDQEKQRRAAIAARMAKLGGRGPMGMGMMGGGMPGPRPPARQASTDQAEKKDDEPVPAPVPMPGIVPPPKEDEETATEETTGEATSETPATIKMPAVPRRTAGPRRRAAGATPSPAASSPVAEMSSDIPEDAPPHTADRLERTAPDGTIEPPPQIPQPGEEEPLPKSEEELERIKSEEDLGRGPLGAEGAAIAGIATKPAAGDDIDPRAPPHTAERLERVLPDGTIEPPLQVSQPGEEEVAPLTGAALERKQTLEQFGAGPHGAVGAELAGISTSPPPPAAERQPTLEQIGAGGQGAAGAAAAGIALAPVAQDGADGETVPPPLEEAVFHTEEPTADQPREAPIPAVSEAAPPPPPRAMPPPPRAPPVQDSDEEEEDEQVDFTQPEEVPNDASLGHNDVAAPVAPPAPPARAVPPGDGPALPSREEPASQEFISPAVLGVAAAGAAAGTAALAVPGAIAATHSRDQREGAPPPTPGRPAESSSVPVAQPPSHPAPPVPDDSAIDTEETTDVKPQPALRRLSDKRPGGPRPLLPRAPATPGTDAADETAPQLPPGRHLTQLNQEPTKEDGPPAVPSGRPTLPPVDTATRQEGPTSPVANVASPVAHVASPMAHVASPVGMDEDSEDRSRREGIAARMAKLGGIKFGAPPPMPRKKQSTMSDELTSPVAAARSPPTASSELNAEPDEVAHEAPREEAAPAEDEEETPAQEAARRRATLARLRAGGALGGFGLFNAQSAEEPEHEVEDERGVQAEEIKHDQEDAEDEDDGPPPPPPRQAAVAPPVPGGRPPIPQSSLPPQPEDDDAPPPPPRPVGSRQQTVDESHGPPPPVPGGRPPMPQSSLPPQPESDDDAPPPPPRPTASSRQATLDSGPPPPPRAAPPPPMGADELEGVSEAHTAPTAPPVPPPPQRAPTQSSTHGYDAAPHMRAPPPPPTGYDGEFAAAPPAQNIGYGAPLGAAPSHESRTSEPRTSMQQNRPAYNELQQASASHGTALARAAKGIFNQGKGAYYGDGSPEGFVKVAFEQAHLPSGNGWGLAIYEQEAGSRMKNFDEPRAGDVAAFHDARFKGKKGLQGYTQQVGSVETPLVGVIAEFDPKNKHKLRVLQVERNSPDEVSYRLDDLKSGRVVVYRVGM